LTAWVRFSNVSLHNVTQSVAKPIPDDGFYIGVTYTVEMLGVVFLPHPSTPTSPFAPKIIKFKMFNNIFNIYFLWRVYIGNDLILISSLFFSESKLSLTTGIVNLQFKY
jgi:hypothetical protein